MEQERMEQEKMKYEEIYEIIRNNRKTHLLKNATVILGGDDDKEKRDYKILVNKLCDRNTKKITYQILIDDGSDIIDAGEVTKKDLVKAVNKSNAFNFLLNYDIKLDFEELDIIANKMIEKDNNFKKKEIETKLTKEEVISYIYCIVKQENFRLDKDGYYSIPVKKFDEIVLDFADEYSRFNIKKMLNENGYLKTEIKRYTCVERIPKNERTDDRETQRVIKLKAIA